MKNDRYLSIGALTACGLLSLTLGFALYQFREIPNNIIFEFLFIDFAVEVGFAALLLAAIVDGLLLLTSKSKTIYTRLSIGFAAAFFQVRR